MAFEEKQWKGEPMSTVRRARALALVVGVVAGASLAATAAVTAVAGLHFSSWSTAQKIDEIDGNSSELNTTFLDGCPIQSPDGLSLYMASNRPRFAGDTRTDLDIWVARRQSRHDPWGAPENLGEPVNSTADDFCPTPIRRGGLFFVSREALPGSCGLGDIYFTRHSRKHGWSEPQHLACAPDGPNSALDEQGPSYVTAGGGAQLYFSRSSATVPGEIFVARGRAGSTFGSAAPVSELNAPGANDIQPNVRKDGREVVFSSNRTGTLGGQDIWVATRAHVRDPWSTPVNLGTSVNTAAAETRPSLSRRAETLLFGRAPGPEGMSDIYVATRDTLRGSDDDDDGDDDDD
jgi:WD40-like Beta Propeller Repeat